MKLIASKKLHLVHGNADRPLDRESIRSALMSGTGTSYHVAMTPEDVEAHVTRQTAMGYTCHIFDYEESRRVTTSIQSIKVA